MFTDSQTMNFSHESLPVKVYRDATELAINEPTIVVNLGGTPATIDEKLGGYIAPINSTVLEGGTHVSGALLLLAPVPTQNLREEQFREFGWADFYGSEENTSAAVLLKSPQESLGKTVLSASTVLADPTAPSEPTPYEVRVNLWFSPENTDCGIHNVHPFIETHTQIMGTGKMQKFRENDHATIYEDQTLEIGQTQPSMFGRWDNESFAYPWHQYRAVTDSVWLAIEYHPLTPADHKVR